MPSPAEFSGFLSSTVSSGFLPCDCLLALLTFSSPDLDVLNAVDLAGAFATVLLSLCSMYKFTIYYNYMLC